VLTKLREISEQDIAKIKEALVRDKRTQFLKSFSWCLPFGAKDIYKCAVCSAGLEKLAQLIKICGFLMQTKVCLFWKKEDWE
jgi:hypothetical protein